MSNPFFERPILYSPYEYPTKHWELTSLIESISTISRVFRSTISGPTFQEASLAEQIPKSTLSKQRQP